MKSPPEGSDPLNEQTNFLDDEAATRRLSVVTRLTGDSSSAPEVDSPGWGTTGFRFLIRAMMDMGSANRGPREQAPHGVVRISLLLEFPDVTEEGHVSSGFSKLGTRINKKIPGGGLERCAVKSTPFSYRVLGSVFSIHRRLTTICNFLTLVTE